MATIEEQIKRIKAETEEKIALLEKEKGILEIFPTLKVSCLKGFNTIDVKNMEEAKTVLLKLKPTTKIEKIKTSSTEYEIDSYYKISIENPAVPNQYNDFRIKIEFISNGEKYWIIMPLNIIESFLTKGTRQVYECEYHYFVGESMSKIRQLRVSCYNFRTQQINYYGVDKTCLKPEEINNIIDFIIE